MGKMSTPELIKILKETAALFRQSDPVRSQQLDEAAERLNSHDAMIRVVCGGFGHG